MNRFSLTKSCLVAAAPCVVATSAFAELATFNFTLDQYAGEARWGILDAANSTVAYSAFTQGMYVGSSLVVGSPAINTITSGSAVIGFTVDISMDLPAGDYVMILIDTFGDGWTGGGVSFSDNAQGDPISFAAGGNQVSGAFTVVPAPASLALLGLAGLTRRRRS